MTTVSPRGAWDRATAWHRREKHRSVSWRLRARTARPCAMPQTSKFPMSVRCVPDQPLSASGSACAPPHAGICAGFVDEHQPCWVTYALLSHATSLFASEFREVALILMGRYKARSDFHDVMEPVSYYRSSGRADN